jgi:hypothetical protein
MMMENEMVTVMMIIIIIIISFVTSLFFLVILLNQQWSPPLRLKASHCSTFHIMCDVPIIIIMWRRSKTTFNRNRIAWWNTSHTSERSTYNSRICESGLRQRVSRHYNILHNHQHTRGQSVLNCRRYSKRYCVFQHDKTYAQGTANVTLKQRKES